MPRSEIALGFGKERAIRGGLGDQAECAALAEEWEVIIMQADARRFALSDPGDVSGLREAVASGAIDPRQVVAVVGKTHGNGLVNDYTRGFLTLALSGLLAEALGTTREAVTARIPFVFSGGVEGVLSPHYTVFTAAPAAAGARPGPALSIGVAISAPLGPAAIGRAAQIDTTAAAAREAMGRAGIENPSGVHLVQVKGPAPTLGQIVASAVTGQPCRGEEPDKLMAYGRAAAALGVARALGEASPEAATEEAVLRDRHVFSSAASISAGTEVDRMEVIVLGMSPRWSGPLAIAHRPMRDALDLAAVTRVLCDLGLSPDPSLPAAETARLRAVFVKCEPQRDGRIRGRAHTMLNDGDINAQRHIRAAVGGLVAGVTGETELFVSGGAEHQGSDGGGLVAVIAERA